MKKLLTGVTCCTVLGILAGWVFGGVTTEELHCFLLSLIALSVVLIEHHLDGRGRA